MYPLVIHAFKKAKRAYHQVMLAYYATLCRDCLDMQRKRLFYCKAKHYEQELNKRI